MNTKIKKIMITLISIILIFSLPTYSKAMTFDSIFGSAQDFISQGSGSSSQGIDEGELKNISDTVSGVLLTVAVAVTFISIGAMGITFAVQTVEDKAKVKESMVPWLIGVLVSFGAYGIWKFVMTIFYNMNL